MGLDKLILKFTWKRCAKKKIGMRIKIKQNKKRESLFYQTINKIDYQATVILEYITDMGMANLPI